MRLTRLYVRFYRSFNYSHERELEGTQQAWELIDKRWFPFIHVDIEPDVTAVVGSNESGKSHLIDAIEHGLRGVGLTREAFCRYSELFSVEAGKMRAPDVGVELEVEDEDDLSAVPFNSKIGSRFMMPCLDGEAPIFLDDRKVAQDLDPTTADGIRARMPAPFRLETEVALPDSISIDALLDREAHPLASRARRSQFLEMFRPLVGATVESLAESAPNIVELLQPQRLPENAGYRLTPAALGRELLLNVARIDQRAFKDLEAAIRDGREGPAAGLVEEMNRNLARHLNFNRWWRQDEEFQLRITPRERELVFTISDRTGTDYSFGERSKGLRYFLSYFVQLQAHRRGTTAQREVLIMDEPDAYLSSVGQQDLLRALEAFARPDDGSRRDQVVYVTHSPFLINRNAAHRLRVLAKGTNEEGTRVVRDVARTHYEPLRSSIGEHVAETAFIGGANMFVEGPADQVLIAGTNAILLRQGNAPRRLLDLNDTTIVPAGGAQAIPYMAYLARGRDQIKPPCIALLDGDDQGRNARDRLAQSDDGSGAPILSADLVIDLTEWAAERDLQIAWNSTPVDLEDLIPMEVMVEAGRTYAMHLLAVSAYDALALTTDLVLEKWQDEPTKGRVWKSFEAAFGVAYNGAGIAKVGFAKEVILYLETVRDKSPRPPGVQALEHNFAELLKTLRDRLEHASAVETETQSRNRTKKQVRGFVESHPQGSSRDQAAGLLDRIEAGLGTSRGDEAVRAALGSFRDEHHLMLDPLEPVADFDGLVRGLRSLADVRQRAYNRAATARPQPKPAERAAKEKAIARPKRTRRKNAAKPAQTRPEAGEKSLG